MSARRLTRRGQRRAEALMLDTCVIQPIIGETTNPPDHPTDPGKVVTEYGPATYEGRCKLQSQRSYPSTPEAGEHQWTLVPLYLHLPVEGTGSVDIDQRVEITASVDPANVGRVFRIRSGDRKSYQTAVRFLVEEVS